MAKTRIIELSDSKRKQVITLPINPAEIEITKVQLNQVIQLLSGEANVLGEPGLDKVNLESFFPAPNSPFYRFANRTPADYEKIIMNWMRGKQPIRLIISDLNFNKAMTIDGFNSKQREGDKDLYYSIALSEYRELNVPSVKVNTTVKASIKRRPAPAAPSNNKSSSGGQSYTVKDSDTLWAIATRFYGNGAQYPKIYDANKDTIESTAKAHGKASSDNGHWIWGGEVFTIP